jgi:galactose mutarotase-like enzyme
LLFGDEKMPLCITFAQNLKRLIMTIIIENDVLRVGIKPNGAELDSIRHKQHQLDYLWQGDAAFWGKQSPILFPIVGTLKDNRFDYKGKSYHLPRHGFARDKTFVVEQQSADKATFLLVSDAESLKIYPFSFELRLHYTLLDNALKVTYDVKNTGTSPMYFSIGGHPAFRLPLVEKTVYTDYFIELNTPETRGRYPLSKDGLLELTPNPFLQNTDTIPLHPSLFYEDAVVLKHISATSMAIRSDKTPHGLRMNFEGFPYFGIWAAKDAPFVCLEPWCGISDSVNTTQALTKKEGIHKLASQKTFERTWEVVLF